MIIGVFHPASFYMLSAHSLSLIPMPGHLRSHLFTKSSADRSKIPIDHSSRLMVQFLSSNDCSATWLTSLASSKAVSLIALVTISKHGAKLVVQQ